MLRTRVGYAGGTTIAPTYRSIGDHAEAIEIDFDPTVISYEDLLAQFFGHHNSCAEAWSKQYRSAIFPHDETQRELADRAARGVAQSRGRSVQTAIEDFTSFTLAEDYHQKYRLRREPAILAEFEALFPTREAFLGSTAVTRANAFLGGEGTRELISRDLPRLGLSDSARDSLRRSIR